MPKINQEEYEILKTKLREGYKWVAKEMALNQWVRVYKRHPDTGFPGIAYPKASDMFVFVKVGDEPYNIAQLIEEYENDYKGSWEHAIEFSKEMRSESEETEVKNIEELKSWFEDDKLYVGEYVKHKINQLDEPEVLSPEWINRNTSPVDDEGRLYVWKRDLQNVLVPKQEEVDRAYKDGYEKGKQHTFYKGYLEGLADKEKESETVADVVSTFWKSYERLKEVMSMEVEELQQ